MSASIVPPQPVFQERWERPRTRLLWFLALLSGLVTVGATVSDWVADGAPMEALPQFIRVGMLVSTLCLMALAWLTRWLEKPRLVMRRVPSAHLHGGIH